MMSVLLQSLLQFFVAGVAVWSFAILFKTSPRHCVFCGIVGGFVWAVYLLTFRWLASAVLASFFSSLILIVLSRFMAVRRRAPIIIFLVAGIFPIVPGTGIYYTALHLFRGETGLALSWGVESVMIGGSIALGILLGSALPYGLIATLARRN